jgi:hypothetical protein
MLIYKFVVTLDAPLQLLANALRFIYRRFKGDLEKTSKSWLAVKSSWHFLVHGLIEFWKA